jgi:Family of unknown function (DUF6502)
VATQSRGIPVRAMLDELTQLGAITLLPSQRVKAVTRLPILTGLTRDAIVGVGERTRDLLATLTTNLKRSTNPFFVGTALTDDAETAVISLVRRDLLEQGANFINSANSLLGRTASKSMRSKSKVGNRCRLGVTVYYFQDGPDSEDERPINYRRKNLRRERFTEAKVSATDSVSHPSAKVQP